MILAKSFFGFHPDSVTDYIFVYSICFIVFIVGLFLLAYLKKYDKPSNPIEMERKCELLLEKFQILIKNIDDQKVSSFKISSDIMSIQMILNQLVYSCTVIIEENRDISYEGLRSSLQLAVQNLDLSNSSAQKSKQKEYVIKANKIIINVESTLEAINKRDAKMEE